MQEEASHMSPPPWVGVEGAGVQGATQRDVGECAGLQLLRTTSGGFEFEGLSWRFWVLS